MTWFSTSTIRTSIAAGLCAGLLVSGVAISPVQQAPSAYAVPNTGGLDLNGSDSSMLKADTRELAPGLQATSFNRLQPEGWVTGDVLIADLSTPTLGVDVRDSGTLTNLKPITEHTLGENTVAAVNGSFFDMNNSGVAQGTNISASDGVRTTTQHVTQSFTIAEGLAAIQALSSTSSVHIDEEDIAVSTVNGIGIPVDGIGYFTQAWGDHPISRAIGGPDNIDPQFLRIEIAGGKIVSMSNDLDKITATVPVASGRGVLLARGAAVELFDGLRIGSELPVTVSASEDVDLAIGGREKLVSAGVAITTTTTVAPRTAVGVSQDGTKIFVVSIDGSQAHSRGMEIGELAEFMVEVGAYNAVNLDGGGSSSLLMREPGTNELTVGNTPSDGTLRSIPNSLVFTSSAPIIGATDLMVTPLSKVETANTVFPGLSRTIRGTGTDANNAAIPVSGEFLVNNEHATIASSTGTEAVVVGVAPGKTSVGYSAQGMDVSTSLRVLGPLNQIRADSSAVALADGDASSTLTITGFDQDGFSAPIETSDITVTAGADVLVTPTGVDSFTITPMVDLGSATVTFSAGGHRVDVAVTVGLEREEISDLSNVDSWTVAHARAQGATVSPSTGPDGEQAITLNYDFSQETGTRGAYAISPEPILIPGQPQAITMMIHGDGNSSWPRLQMRTGAGTVTNFDGPDIDWHGWKEVSFPVPIGTAFPLKLERLRIMEIAPTSQYIGATSFAGLTAVVAPDVAQPVAPVIHDPFVLSQGTVNERAQRIAVMSDAQFVARTPNSQNEQGARQTLREILAADPELIVINGDFVDEAAKADYDLARTVLTEEIGDRIPWVYVPGNHEIMAGPIQNFIDEFAPTKTKTVVGQTMIITLNTANGSLNSSDATQLRYLEAALAEAEADADITGVLVFAHHPSDDPKTSKDSQINDRLEAKRFKERLAEFRNDTGKSIAALHAHAGVFHATSNDGVSTLLTGNSGKSPSSTPDRGGFTGWAMLGLNPELGKIGVDPHPVTSRTDWMQAEIRARVDSLTLGSNAALPDTMVVGDAVTVEASILQDGTRTVPVRWPVSAQWGGTGVVVDDGMMSEQRGQSAMTFAEAQGANVLRFNPSTGALTATTAGEATLQVTVNGITETHTIKVTVPADKPDGGSGNNGSGNNGTPGNPSESGNGTQNGNSEVSDELSMTGSEALIPWLAAALAAAFALVGAMLLPKGLRRTKD